jgi:hypothetical protein
MTPPPNLFLRSAALVHSLLFPSKLPRYLHAPGFSWALVTGSTSGVGLALASELCSRGFNVILHGRNQAKLEDVRSKLLIEFPSRQSRLLYLMRKHVSPGRIMRIHVMLFSKLAAAAMYLFLSVPGVIAP